MPQKLTRTRARLIEHVLEVLRRPKSVRPTIFAVVRRVAERLGYPDRVPIRTKHYIRLALVQAMNFGLVNRYKGRYMLSDPTIDQHSRFVLRCLKKNLPPTATAELSLPVPVGFMQCPHCTRFLRCPRCGEKGGVSEDDFCDCAKSLTAKPVASSAERKKRTRPPRTMRPLRVKYKPRTSQGKRKRCSPTVRTDKQRVSASPQKMHSTTTSDWTTSRCMTDCEKDARNKPDES